MSGYDVHFRLPKDLPTGEYEAFVHNGYGGPAGWSNALKLTVRAAQVWPTKQFNVREFGAVGDGKADDAPAIQAALDAASANGGGIVLLPPGSYLINKTLTVAPRTVVRGNSRERTWIWLPNGVHYGTREAGLAVEV
ncbi:MAG: peptidase, partial [Planctomycetes bacterium]|nr:peptidase [Planctomycetota bacterium]